MANEKHEGAEDGPLNVRIYSDGHTKESKQSFISYAVAIVTLMIYCGWVQILLSLIIASFFSRWALIVTVLLFSTLLLPPKPVLWKAFNRSWVFQTWREYFSFSYVFEEAMDHNKHYIFCEFPHGVFPMGPLIASTLCQTLFDRFEIFSLAASSVYTIPFWRHFIAWMGALPATSANFKKLLRKGSVAVIVGGIAEMYMQHPNKEQVKARDRKGFARIAVEEGADGIVPVFHFGNSMLLDFYPQSLQGLSRKLRSSLGILVGRFGLPLPRRHPVFMATGPAIKVPKLAKDHPDFEKTVDEVHAKVLEELQKLYDRHKASFGWSNRPLEIL